MPQLVEYRVLCPAEPWPYRGKYGPNPKHSNNERQCVGHWEFGFVHQWSSYIFSNWYTIAHCKYCCRGFASLAIHSVSVPPRDIRTKGARHNKRDNASIVAPDFGRCVQSIADSRGLVTVPRKS